MKLPRNAVVSLTLITLFGAASTAGAFDDSKQVSLEFRQIKADHLFKVLADVGGAPLQLNAPVGEEKLNVKFQNAPLSTVLQVVTAQLGVQYREEGGALVVEPRGASPSVSPPATPTPSPAPVVPVGSLQLRIAELEGEVAALKRERDALQGELGAARQEAVSLRGAPVPMPAHLPPRLSDANALQRAFHEGLRQAGFSGDVTSVDCTEYPCIVFGTGFGRKDDMKKLKEADAMAPYRGDSTSVFGWATGPADGRGESYFFGAALYPHEDSHPDENFSLRLRSRVEAMHQTVVH